LKCPNCQNPNLAYTVKPKRVKVRDVKKGEMRTDFGAECKKGEIKPDFTLIEKGKINVVEEMDKMERRESLEEGRKE